MEPDILQSARVIHFFSLKISVSLRSFSISPGVGLVIVTSVRSSGSEGAASNRMSPFQLGRYHLMVWLLLASRSFLSGWDERDGERRRSRC